MRIIGKHGKARIVCKETNVNTGASWYVIIYRDQQRFFRASDLKPLKRGVIL